MERGKGNIRIELPGDKRDYRTYIGPLTGGVRATNRGGQGH